MVMKRICLVLFYTACLLGAHIALAEEKDYPAKPIEAVLPFDPGGVMDIASRIVAAEMAIELKVPFIVTNAPGAGGMTGAVKVLRAKPDGYTLLSTSTASMISTPLESPNPPYDSFKDFLPIGCFGSSPMIFGVAGTSPFKTMAEMVDYAKKNPGKLTCGVTSMGGENHLNFELFKKVAGVNIKIVPYKGTGEAVASLLGKHIDMMVLTYVGFLPYLKSGDARVLAITQKVAGTTIPTIAEVGYPQVNIHMLCGFFISAKTPKAIYDKLVSTFQKVAMSPGVAKKLEDSGMLRQYKTPQEFTNEMKERWGTTAKLVEELGLRSK